MNACAHSELTCAYAAQALPRDEAAAAAAHLAACPDCRRELDSLRPAVDRLLSWPDVIRPAATLQARLAHRLAAESGAAVPPPAGDWSEPAWDQVAPGIACQLFASDTDSYLVSMLVRLAPGASYPAHRHVGT